MTYRLDTSGLADLETTTTWASLMAEYRQRDWIAFDVYLFGPSLRKALLRVLPPTLDVLLMRKRSPSAPLRTSSAATSGSLSVTMGSGTLMSSLTASQALTVDCVAYDIVSKRTICCARALGALATGRVGVLRASPRGHVQVTDAMKAVLTVLTHRELVLENGIRNCSTMGWSWADLHEIGALLTNLMGHERCSDGLRLLHHLGLLQPLLAEPSAPRQEEAPVQASIESLCESISGLDRLCTTRALGPHLVLLRYAAVVAYWLSAMLAQVPSLERAQGLRGAGDALERRMIRLGRLPEEAFRARIIGSACIAAELRSADSTDLTDAICRYRAALGSHKGALTTALFLARNPTICVGGPSTLISCSGAL